MAPYIPDFEYLLVPLNAYSDQDIIAKGDELSLIMLINKLRSAADFKKLKEIPPEYFEHLKKQTPQYLLDLISRIITVLMGHLNIPQEEVNTFTDLIERRKFDMMFDCFEGYDVQEARRNWLQIQLLWTNLFQNLKRKHFNVPKSGLTKLFFAFIISAMQINILKAMTERSRFK